MAECRCVSVKDGECVCGQRVSLQGWTRVRSFLFDLTDPEKYAFAVKDPDITRRALELLELFK